MTALEKDLNFYWNEAYSKNDIKAGAKLLSEIAGIAAVGGFVLSVLFVWLPGIGIPVSAAIIVQTIRGATQIYPNLNSEERKKVRAVVRFVNGGIRFLD